MIRRAAIYDIARLATRFSRPTPNGIDRVDLGYAKHFLSRERGSPGVILGPTGPRAIKNAMALRIVEAIEAHWAEQGPKDSVAALSRLKRFLDPANSTAENAEAGQTLDASASLAKRVGALCRGATLGGRALLSAQTLPKAAPEGAVYVNASQFPLWIDGYFRWLDRRPDIKAVFFVHDLLPLRYPELFPPAEAARHAKRMEVLARRAAGVIVATPYTRDALVDHLRAQGLPVPPLLVAPLPVSAEFLDTTHPPAPAPRSAPYFVSIGTLEPRKNHLLLLHIWRELAEELGDQTPKLVLIGARGWENENVLDLIERCERLRPFVIEVQGLSTPALVEILRGAAAVLMPSHAEGFGLPVAEAMATGTPVIASDIPPFRTLPNHPTLTTLDPIDGLGWQQAILDCLRPRLPVFPASDDHRKCTAQTWMWHMSHVDGFIASL